MRPESLAFLCVLLLPPKARGRELRSKTIDGKNAEEAAMLSESPVRDRNEGAHWRGEWKDHTICAIGASHTACKYGAGLRRQSS